MDHVLVANTEYAVGEDGAEIPTRIRFYAEVLDRLRTVPGVTAAAGAAYLPMGREPRAPRDYFVQGRPVPPRTRSRPTTSRRCRSRFVAGATSIGRTSPSGRKSRL
jgi:hypothetical protein